MSSEKQNLIVNPVEDSLSSTQIQDKQKETKRKVQYCRMFDVFMKDVKDDGDSNGEISEKTRFN